MYIELSIQFLPIENIMAGVEFLIFYKPNDKNSMDFLNDYNKKIKDKAAQYNVKIQVINITQISRAQAVSLQDYIKKNVYPFAFVINGNTKAAYTNIEQIYELIVTAITSAKSALVKRNGITGSGGSVGNSAKRSGRSYESYDDYGSVDFLELERRKKLGSEEVQDDTMSTNKGDIYGGDIHSSMIIPRSAPVQGSGNASRGVPDNSFDRDPNRLGYDSSEMEMISRATSDFDDIDLDLRNHLQGNAMIDPGQEEMMAGANADKLNPSGLF